MSLGFDPCQVWRLLQVIQPLFKYNGKYLLRQVELLQYFLAYNRPPQQSASAADPGSPDQATPDPAGPQPCASADSSSEVDVHVEAMRRMPPGRALILTYDSGPAASGSGAGRRRAASGGSAGEERGRRRSRGTSAAGRATGKRGPRQGSLKRSRSAEDEGEDTPAVPHKARARRHKGADEQDATWRYLARTEQPEEPNRQLRGSAGPFAAWEIPRRCGCLH